MPLLGVGSKKVSNGDAASGAMQGFRGRFVRYVKGEKLVRGFYGSPGVLEFCKKKRLGKVQAAWFKLFECSGLSTTSEKAKTGQPDEECRTWLWNYSATHGFGEGGGDTNLIDISNLSFTDVENIQRVLLS